MFGSILEREVDVAIDLPGLVMQGCHLETDPCRRLARRRFEVLAAKQPMRNDNEYAIERQPSVLKATAAGGTAIPRLDYA